MRKVLQVVLLEEQRVEQRVELLEVRQEEQRVELQERNPAHLGE